MEQKKYTLVINKKRIPVTKEVYKAYYQHREHEIYEGRLYSNNTISLEEAEEKGISRSFIIWCRRKKRGGQALVKLRQPEMQNKRRRKANTAPNSL